MANPSRFPMFIRLVDGNTATPYPGALAPDPDERRVSAHTLIASLQMWANGEITKAALVARYNFTHTDDSGDLDDLKGWYDAATKKEKFSDVLEWRLILARDKRGAGTAIDLDGSFGYAVKSTFVNGADGVHSLEDTGPVAAQFNSWA